MSIKTFELVTDITIITRKVIMYLIYLALIPCIILEAKACQSNDMATAKRDDKGKKTHLSDTHSKTVCILEVLSTKA